MTTRRVSRWPRLVAAYLSFLGYDDRPPPTLESLAELHRRHLARVPYENLEIMLGRPPSVDPLDSLARVGRRGPGRLLLPPERRPRDRARRPGLRRQPARRPRVDHRRRPVVGEPEPPRAGRLRTCPPTTTRAATGGPTSGSATRSSSRCRWPWATTSRAASPTRSPRCATTAGPSGPTRRARSSVSRPARRRPWPTSPPATRRCPPRPTDASRGCWSCSAGWPTTSTWCAAAWPTASRPTGRPRAS